MSNAHHNRCLTCGTINGHHPACLVGSLVQALKDMLEHSAHLPVFGGEASVKNVRKAAKWIKACEDAKAVLAKAGES